jgi:predicted phosphodiesterase
LAEDTVSNWKKKANRILEEEGSPLPRQTLARRDIPTGEESRADRPFSPNVDERPSDAPAGLSVPEWAREDDGDPNFSFPESPAKRADTWLRLDGDFGLISDIHVPYYDHRVLEKFAETCYRKGVRRFIAVGDTMDGNQFHPKRGGVQTERRYQDDVETCKVLLRQLLRIFESGIILNGNHDYWFQAHMRGQIDPEWLLSNIFHEFEGRIVWSEFEQATVYSGDREFRLLHGANYSGPNPLGVAKQYSAKFECGVVMGHEHHHEAGFSRSGKHQVVVMGGAHDMRRLAYIHRSPRTNPVQTNGFAILKEGWVKDYPLRFD